MFSSLKRNVLSFATVSALAFVPLASHAEGGDGGDYLLPGAQVKKERVTESRPLSCAEATRAAWFQRDLEITDGDVTPNIAMPAQCDRKVFAKNEPAKTK